MKIYSVLLEDIRFFLLYEIRSFCVINTTTNPLKHFSSYFRYINRETVFNLTVNSRRTITFKEGNVSKLIIIYPFPKVKIVFLKNSLK